jgi:hypothetical protein
MPGRSFAGKTSLVAALIARGASYFSDEYAVLDPDGRVHPYPKPLSFRNSDLRIDTTETSADELGAVSAEASARIALVAVTSYRPEADWQPTPGGVADAALALFEYAVLARSEPQRVMGAVASAAADARLLEGDRGEAGETAVALLEALAGASRTTPSRWP